MYFIKIESFVFSDLSHCKNTLPVLKSSFFISIILFCGRNSVLACVTDEVNPGIVRLRISDQKLVPFPACYQGFYNRF